MNMQCAICKIQPCPHCGLYQCIDTLDAHLQAHAISTALMRTNRLETVEEFGARMLADMKLGMTFRCRHGGTA